ncbi:TPA: hypothetical protein P0E19_005005 [Vibrio campbellii]|nr:hypothetical protein [Vibrio campbellii]
MIITVSNSKGGVGKSTTALGIGVSLGADLFVEKDTDNELSELNPIRESYGYPRLPIVSPKGAQELAPYIERGWGDELVMIDCGGFDSDLVRISIAASDILVVPTSDNVIELRKLMKYDKMLSDIRKNTGSDFQAYILIAKVAHNATNFSIFEQVVEASENFKLLTSKLTFLKADHNKAMERGLSVVEDKRTKGSKAAREIKALSREISTLMLK